MNVLGISCFYHDAAAALLVDGQLIAASEEERFSRKKHDAGFPNLAIQFCLQQAGIGIQDVDYVVFYEKPFVKFERILTTALQAVPRSWKVFGDAMTTWLLDKLWVKNFIRQPWQTKQNQRRRPSAIARPASAWSSPTRWTRPSSSKCPAA